MVTVTMAAYTETCIYMCGGILLLSPCLDIFLALFYHDKHFHLQVAKESALRFNPNANIVAYHDSIMG